eukprot:2044106-Rhodomonas_salina.1
MLMKSGGLNVSVTASVRTMGTPAAILLRPCYAMPGSLVDIAMLPQLRSTSTGDAANSTDLAYAATSTGGGYAAARV